MRDNAALGYEEPAVRLVEHREICRESIGREAPRDLSPVELLVRDVVLVARSERAVVDALARFENPRDGEELLPGLVLELAPQLVRAAQERHVVRMLEVPEPDDPRQSVGRAVLVQHVEAFEPEHAAAPPSEVVERCAPHPADSDHDRVVPLHRRVTLSRAG